MMQSAETGALPVLRTARRAGLIEQVIDQVRDQILAGTWPIGSRIPTESELAQLTGTSRNTVREAVQSLVHAGLLERRQGSGTYVLAASELAGAVSRRVATAHHVHVLEVRRTLEVGAARLAALHRTADDVARLRGLIAERNAAARRGEVDVQIAADVALHRAIGQAAHNPVLNELYENVVDTLSENVRSNLDLHGGSDETEHVALVDAIDAQDPQRAEVEAAGFLDDLLTLLSAQRPAAD
jgi:DNA-binding FadR family transcriptional regulator